MMTKTPFSLPIATTLAALSFCVAGLSMAQSQPTTPSSQSYEDALAQCEELSGDSKVSCKRDAYAAHHDSHRTHTAPDQQTLEQNRLLRCQSLPTEQRQDCIDHMQGAHETQTYGSVKGGGRLRQSTITIEGEPQPQTQTTQPQSQPQPAPSSNSRSITPLR